MCSDSNKIQVFEKLFHFILGFIQNFKLKTLIISLIIQSLVGYLCKF